MQTLLPVSMSHVCVALLSHVGNQHTSSVKATTYKKQESPQLPRHPLSAEPGQNAPLLTAQPQVIQKKQGRCPPERARLSWVHQTRLCQHQCHSRSNAYGISSLIKKDPLTEENEDYNANTTLLCLSTPGSPPLSFFLYPYNLSLFTACSNPTSPTP